MADRIENTAQYGGRSRMNIKLTAAAIVIASAAADTGIYLPISSEGIGYTALPSLSEIPEGL